MTEEPIALLRAGNHSLVVVNGGTRTFDGKGITDLYILMKDEPEFLRGASVADKVVGKGAAALMILGGVREVFAEVASTPALRLLRDAGLLVRAENEVSHIINRSGDDICPVERLCMSCHDAKECLPLIENFIAAMR